MKKLILVSAIAMSGLIYQNANAQIGVHFNINLGTRPVVVAQAPVYNDVDYYYLPDVGAYYSVNQHCYYYQDGGAWISATYLPGYYRNYDWQHERHFAVNEQRPYMNNEVYRARFGGFEGRRDWNYRDERSTRVYADRDRFDHDQYRQHGGDRDYQQNNQRNDDRGRFDNRNEHQQQSQQNNNRGYNHGNDNNRGGNDNRQGRGGRF